MELFYLANLDDDDIVLDEDQLRHAVKVLRKRVGDEISITDGKGCLCHCRFEQIDRRRATLQVIKREQLERQPYGITVAMALTKNIKRIEWALEKMTEMSIVRFVPLLLKRSERHSMNRLRLEKIMVSAMKQSQQVYLPELSDFVQLDEFVNSDQLPAAKYIGYKSEASQSVRDNYCAGSDVVFLIGPEGDFTSEELEAVIAAGFMPVGLGKTRLRTETAAVAAVAYIHGLNS